MTAIAEADSAIDDVVDSIELVPAAELVATTSHGEVVDADAAPCTADEARALIKKAVNAANDFYAAIAELLSREAHIALGYESPRQMINAELSGALTNPRTGNPVSDRHLRRMTRVAWLLWSIAKNTGYDMADLAVPERAVRAVSQSVGGVDDDDISKVITARVNEVRPDTTDEVNDIIIEVLEQAAEGKLADSSAGGATHTPAPKAGSGNSGDSETAAVAGSGGGRRPDEDHEDHEDHEDLDDVDDLDDGVDSEAPNLPGDSGALKPSSQPSTPQAPSTSVTSIFDTELPEGVETAVSDQDITSALEHMRTAADVRRVMGDIARIHALLPAITKIKKHVPEVVDAIDDDELSELEAELRSTDAAVEWAATARQVLADALDEVDTRHNEAI